MKICVLIRVYNRLTDLYENLEVIRSCWNLNDYFVIVIANGKDSGFVLTEKTELIDKLVYLDQNSGHLSGNSQLLLEGIKHIPQDCDFTVLLEADTWIFDDKIIDKYINLLQKNSAVWASSEWLEKYFSLGLDFAVVKTEILKAHPEIFRFEKHAESFVCNFLIRNKMKYIYIKEMMPVHIPKLMRHFYNPFGGRNRSFIKGKMTTHHLEDLKNGLEDKKKIANIMLGYHKYPNGNLLIIKLGNMFLNLIRILTIIMPRSKWIKAKKMRII